MKIKSIIAMLLAGCVLAGVTSCKEEEAEYTPADVLTGQQVYFSNTTATTIELPTDANSVAIPLYRVNTKEAISVNVASESNNDNIKVAPTASFAADSKVADVVISYDPEKVEAGKYDTITVSISDDNYTTPYGITQLTLLVGQKEPWLSLGYGYYADSFIDDYFWKCEILQNQNDPTRYRIMKPYGAMWNYYGEADFYAASSEYMDIRVLEDGEEFNGVKVEGEGQVYFSPTNTGEYVDNYSDYIWAYHVAHFKAASTELYQNNAITAYQEDGSIGCVEIAPYHYMPEYGGGWNHTGSTYITIYFPGYEPSDYSLTVSYAGRFFDADENLFAVANLEEVGADVAEVKLVVVPGKDNVSDALDILVFGEKESDAVISTTVKDAAKYNLPMPADAESGKYTIVAVSFDSEGEAQDYDYDTFSYTASGEVKETWTPVYVGDYEYTIFFGSEDEPEVDPDLVLFQSDTNPNRYKIEHWGYDVDFIFSMDPETGLLAFDDFFTGYSHPSYGDVYGVDIYNSYADEEPSYYKDGVFYFNISYEVSAGSFGGGFEKFTLTGNYSAAKSRLAKAAKAPKTKKSHKTNLVQAKPTMKNQKVKNYRAKVSKAVKPAKAVAYDVFSKYAK